MGKAIDVSEGEDPGISLIDSPDCHSGFWESHDNFQSLFYELKEVEYQSISRGRVVYYKTDKSFIIYLDNTLMNEASKCIVSPRYT